MRTILLASCLVMLAAEQSSNAGELSFQVEPAVALWVDDPQADRFALGGNLALRPGLSLGRIATLQGTYALLVTPYPSPKDGFGSAHFVMGGLRLRPFSARQPDSRQLGGLFIDGDIGYVRTGELNRLGFDAGLGFDFQVAPRFAIGPFARYTQIVQPDDRAGMSPDDAQLVMVGLNMIFGSKRESWSEAEVEYGSSTTPTAPAPATPGPCADRDRDGVCDAVDRCPRSAGPAATYGCPVDPCGGRPLTVQVQFDYDSAEMPDALRVGPQTMDPVLDAVAEAIARQPSCQVCIVGYASEEGSDEYNQELSERRAEAVADYMTGHGLAGRSIPTAGLGSRCQLVPEASRELNRRVDFSRLEEGESCPTDCPSE